jgi:Cu2+-containing amine oxidase
MATPPSSVLRIRSALFMYHDRSGQPRWITVARDLQLGEVFVPYDRGSPRFQDVSAHPFWITRADESFLGPNCVAPGKVLTSPDPNHDRKVYREVHDDGPRWVSDGGWTGGDRCRRGEKLLLWAVFYGANYRYLIEYGFQDDGTITCRLGATARNIFSRRDDRGDTHLHVACWRFDPDLGDPTGVLPGGHDKNLVRLARRVVQTPAAENGKFRTVVEPFAPAEDEQSREGSAYWQPEEFTALRIESTERRNHNDEPQPTAYDLIPIRTGTVRHFPPSFDFVNKDFWVTLSDPSHTTFNEVATYAARQLPIDRRPVTVWHSAPVLHVARAEDFGPDGRSNYDGIALTAWSACMLRPRNLFDSTPLFRP